MPYIDVANVQSAVMMAVIAVGCIAFMARLKYSKRKESHYRAMITLDPFMITISGYTAHLHALVLTSKFKARLAITIRVFDISIVKYKLIGDYVDTVIIKGKIRYQVIQYKSYYSKRYNKHICITPTMIQLMTGLQVQEI